jgi:hypothetical protein
MENALVSQFMDVTACTSQTFALRHLSSCQWNVEKAIDLYFTAGGHVAGPSDAAPPSWPVQEPAMEENEVRAPLPVRAERLYEDFYYGSGGHIDQPAPSPWAAPPPKPVPVQGLSASEIQASGWGLEAASDNGSDDVGEEENFKDSRQPHCGVLTDDLSSVEDYGVDSDEEQDGDDEEDEEVDVVNYNKDDDEEEDQEEEEEESDDDSDMEDYGLETDEDEVYFDSLTDLEVLRDEGDQPPPPPPPPQPRPATLDQMFRPPIELMFHGTFHYAKVHAATQDQFLLVNLQAATGPAEFASFVHNRDLWADTVVKQTVKDNLVFLLLRKLDGHFANEGAKVCTFYKVQDDQLPAVLVLDPITGQLLDMMSGTIKPDEFMHFIEKYTKSKPSEHSRPKIVPKTVATPTEGSEAVTGAGGEQEQAVPESSASPADQEAAPAEIVDSDDEPMEGEKMCKLRVRFPDGSVITKEFGCQRRVSKLFVFCKSAVRDAGKTEQAAFRIMRFNGRAFQELENNGETFEDLGLNLATVSLVFAT